MKRIGLKWELMLLCILLVTLPTVLMGVAGYFSYQRFAHNELESRLQQSNKEIVSLAYDLIDQNDRVLRREEGLVLKRIISVAELSQNILSTLPYAAQPVPGEPLHHTLLQHMAGVRLNRSGHIFLLNEQNQALINPQFLADASSVRFYNGFITRIEQSRARLLSGEVVTIRYPWRQTADGVYLYRQSALAYLTNWQMVVGVTINETDYKSSNLIHKLQNQLRLRMAHEKIGEHGYLWVFNSRGEYVVSRDHLRDGEDMSDIRDQHGHSLVNHIISTAINQPPGDTRMVYYQWRGLNDRSPIPKAAAVSYIPEWDWVIGASASLNDFYAGLYEIRNRIFLICALFIILGSIIAYIFAEMITQPIKHLEALAVKAADGDLSVRVDHELTSQHSEVRSLAKAFAKMIRNLSQLMQQKEQSGQMLSLQNEALLESEEKLKSALQALEEEKQKLHTQAITDPLTNLLNRRGFSLAGHREWHRNQRDDAALTIAMIDIDYFKQINDSHSHAVGDEVLIQLANLLREQIRQSDLVARIGGEEFALILNQPLGEAEVALERLRKLVEANPVTLQDQVIPYTISIGAVEARAGQYSSLEAALDAADNNLYCAKRQGRNCLISELKSA
ncbi:sensor domain-containing diguanylate cyclase [Neptuniibacter halophilus]|uniref:sensor domain-containing diguanylate cyclase n=1 Tax=Neptuniibacter halophilus TaxID=651666 RepID=UPI002572C758|nr:diguanylate cyclase [Neptuniibacter halophilus]